MNIRAATFEWRHFIFKFDYLKLTVFGEELFAFRSPVSKGAILAKELGQISVYVKLTSSNRIVSYRVQKSTIKRICVYLNYHETLA
ncbi:hypothetical protein GCM10011418_11740 [Sphingobacterium alkalisoli]|nr:hypothetical protein GCM10011418_11740 [Sphingobacterium alkalisoli]